MHAQKAEQKNLDLSFQYDVRLPDMVLGDPTRLTQIILNLVGNAIKFTNKGNVEVYAKLNSVENEIYQVEFSVKDNGIGIPEDNLADIFERFKQAEPHTTRNYGGTGLGLSIAKRLAELQGGTIAMTSKVGVGSVFTFILPFKKTDQIKSEKNNNFEENDIYGLGKLSILVVEDNPINIKFVTSLFSYYKIHADIAENGIIAIEKIKDKNYDIVLMDIEMPQLNGYETTKVIRDELKLDIPIIAMTAHAMAGEKEKCQRLGMNDYVSKPIKSELLFEKMLSAVSLKIKNDTNTIFNNKTSLENLMGNATITNKVINLDFILESFMGNNALIVETIEIFLQEVPKDLASLNMAISNADHNNIKRFAHKMKSAISMMGIYDLVYILEEIETLGSSEQALEKIRALKNSINLLCEKGLQELKVDKFTYI